MSLPARGMAAVLAAAMCMVCRPARGDIYAAEQALAKEDLPRAFELYRELAELGRADAQEIVAVMYVNGEGVKRDNTLGYGWASIALSNGASGKDARNIIDQLESHMTPAARQRVAEVVAQYGREALQKSLLPADASLTGMTTGPACGIHRAVSPDDYYPKDAIEAGATGTVLSEAAVFPDGHAHNTQIWFSIPSEGFAEPSRRIMQDSASRRSRVIRRRRSSMDSCCSRGQSSMSTRSIRRIGI